MENDRGGGMTEGRGGFLGLLNVSAHVVCDNWCDYLLVVHGLNLFCPS